MAQNECWSPVTILVFVFECCGPFCADLYYRTMGMDSMEVVWCHTPHLACHLAKLLATSDGRSWPRWQPEHPRLPRAGWGGVFGPCTPPCPTVCSLGRSDRKGDYHASLLPTAPLWPKEIPSEGRPWSPIIRIKITCQFRTAMHSGPCAISKLLFKTWKGFFFCLFHRKT